MSKALSDARLDRMAMIAWAHLRNITTNVEARWSFVREDSVTDTFRELARKQAKECGFV
jgi:hypothetical protein